jgi:glycosyltransferase involved in cell wall biosynthesis
VTRVSSTNYDVVIPAFNAAATLGETLATVFAQTLTPARVIVVDDGSTDATAEIARSAGAEVLSQANRGPGTATTLGMAAATSPFLAFVDADDLWLAHKMERQLEVLVATEELAAVVSLQRQFRHGNLDDGTGEVRRGLTRSSLALPLKLALQVGVMEDMPGRRGEMIEWLQRARDIGMRLIELPEVLVLRRITPGSLSSGRDADRDRGYLAVAHAATLRNRQRIAKAAASQPQTGRSRDENGKKA